MVKNILAGLLLFITMGVFLLNLTSNTQLNQESHRPNPSVIPTEIFAFPLPEYRIAAKQTKSSLPLEEPEKILTPVEEEKLSQTPNPPPVLALPKAQLPYGKLNTSIPEGAQGKTVYLTFDDGPGTNTQKIIDILDKNKIQGSFFWVGHNLAAWLNREPTNQALIADMLKKGEVIGSHTMDHTSLKSKGLDSQIKLIKESIDFISEKVGEPIRYFRPPYGAVDQDTAKAAEETKQVITYWQVDSEDWKYPNNPDKVLHNIMSELAPGAIILLHEKATTVEMLQRIIDTIKEKGYQFAPLPNL